MVPSLMLSLCIVFATTVADISDLMRRLQNGDESTESSESSSGNEGNSDSGEGEYCSLFTDEEYSIIKSKKIRKEIRSLTDEEWDDFVDAMWIMKNTSQTEGQLKYGEDFRNYDRFVCMHMSATTNKFGDQGHYSHVFLVWHRAFSLLFVRSLYSINKNIVVPYWDFRLDINDTENSIVFSNDYFGPISSDDPQGTVSEGRFAYWPISSFDDVDPNMICNVENITSPFGLLRGKTNSNSNKYLTRFGTNVCGFDGVPVGSAEMWDECLNNSYTNSSSMIDDFIECMDLLVHALPHVYVSGTQPFDSSTQKTLVDAIMEGIVDLNAPDLGWCSNWAFNTRELNNIHYSPPIPILNCFECPKCDVLENGENEYPDCMCNPSSRLIDNKCYVSNDLEPFDLFDIEWQWKPGEMTDISASPNEPLFFLHHLNLDRYFYEFQLKHFDEIDNYYGYYTSGSNYGGNLNDIMNIDDPFIDLFRKDFGDSGPYSAKDIIDYTTFLNADYTYDTILDLIKPCHYDESSDESDESDDGC